MDHIERRKASLCDLPQEMLESIVIDLDLLDYLYFPSDMVFIRLITILNKIQTPKNDASEIQNEDCQFRRSHYISRGHILSGDMIQRAARSHSYYTKCFEVSSSIIVLLFERLQVVLIGSPAKHTSKATWKGFAGCSQKDRL
jgi:hypothetical protein